MKIINFGSLNIDRVYAVPHHVKPGETISATALGIHAGGKGLNQSVAAARAGAAVLHAGAVGPDGTFLTELLAQAGVDTGHMLHVEGESGHAAIQVDPNGQNAIIVYPGSNHAYTPDYIRSLLELGEPGDLVLLQNEINCVSEVITQAHQRGLSVVFNPSPFPAEKLPYELVDWFLLNELEGASLAGLPVDSDPQMILDTLAAAYPHASIVLTLGSKGSICRTADGTLCRQSSFPVSTVDTTAAGDTFTGYFLAGLCRKASLAESLQNASAAAAIAVTRPGAAPSIPQAAEVEHFLAQV